MLIIICMIWLCGYKILPVSNIKLSTSDLIISPIKCTFVYFTQVSPSKTLRDGQFSIRFIGLVDGPRQTPVKVALFGAAAEDPPNPDDIVRVSGVYPYRRRKRSADEDEEDIVPSFLGTRQKSKVEVNK